jgi:hypothetical protein
MKSCCTERAIGTAGLRRSGSGASPMFESAPCTDRINAATPAVGRLFCAT